MPHGTPDFQQTSGVNTVYQLTDMAELAARLGSIVTFDRRGDVFLLEDFDYGLSPWSTLVDGVSGAVDLSHDYRNTRQFSARLQAGTGEDNSTGLYRTIPLPSLSKIGIEASFSYSNNVSYLLFKGEFCDGHIKYYPVVKYDVVNDTLSVYIAVTGWVVFATGVSTYPNVTHFCNAKLVFDIVSGKYVRFMLNNITYDLSAYTADIAYDESYPYVTPVFYVYNKNGVLASMFIDDVILTQNE